MLFRSDAAASLGKLTKLLVSGGKTWGTLGNMRHSRGRKASSALPLKLGTEWRQRGPVFASLAGLGGLALAASLVGANVFHTPATSAAEPTKETLIVHEVPTQSDLTLAGVAKHVASDFDAQKLASLPKDELVTEANDCYLALQELAEKPDLEGERYLVDRKSVV